MGNPDHGATCTFMETQEIGTLLPNNKRQHRTSRAPKDVLSLRMCANCCGGGWADTDQQRMRRTGSRTRGSANSS